MALDITKIPGYKDGMTAEEQIALLKITSRITAATSERTSLIRPPLSLQTLRSNLKLK